MYNNKFGERPSLRWFSRNAMKAIIKIGKKV